MLKRGRAVLLLSFLASLAASLPSAQARITRPEILRTEPAFVGKTFGDTGRYEHVTAGAEQGRAGIWTGP